jgi:hypothetical protein
MPMLKLVAPKEKPKDKHVIKRKRPNESSESKDARREGSAKKPTWKLTSAEHVNARGESEKMKKNVVMSDELVGRRKMPESVKKNSTWKLKQRNVGKNGDVFALNSRLSKASTLKSQRKIGGNRTTLMKKSGGDKRKESRRTKGAKNPAARSPVHWSRSTTKAEAVVARALRHQPTRPAPG